MMDTLAFLIRHRVRARPLSYPWCRLWAKRLVNLGGLLGILYRRRRLSGAAKIGRLSVVGKVRLNGRRARLTVGDGCVIGDRVHLALHDEIRIGDNVVVNDGCVLLTGSHDVDSADWVLLHAPIVIEDCAWIATNATILPGVTVGYAAVVGAGAVVTKNVPPFHVVAGNPARTVKRRRSVHRELPVRFLAPFEAWVGLPRTRIVVEHEAEQAQ